MATPELRTENYGDLVLGLPDGLPIPDSGWPLRPFQIVSLLEMLKQYGHAFYWLGQVLGGLGATLKTVDSNVRDRPIPEDSVTSIFKKIKLAKGWANATKLEMAILSMDRILALKTDNVTFAQLKEALADVERRVGDQLQSEMFLHLAKEQATLFNTPPLLSPKAMRRFPKIAEDIQEAAKCLAVGRYTACVFHLMRVMEIGVQRCAKKLNISIAVEEKEWGKLLGVINGEIKRMPYATAAEKKKRNDYAAASTYLENVKDAWRNPTMHPKETYTEEEADLIYLFVKRYMEQLAKLA